MTYARDTLDTLIDTALADIDSGLQDTDARLPVSLLSVLALVTAGQCDGLYGYIDYIARQIPWPDADEDVLKRWASLVNVFQKQSQAATGAALASKCTPGRSIPVNTALRRTDGVEYLVTQEVVIAADGTATVPVAALDPGAGGNAVAGVKLALTETLPGIVSPLVVGNAGLNNGFDAESPESLLGRFMDYWRGAEEGAGPYVKLAKAVAGVTRAWEYEHEMGLGTITIRFVMDGKPDIIPNAEEIAAVNAYVQANRPPGGGGVYVTAPIPDPLNLTLAVTPATEAVKAAVVAEVTDFVKREHDVGDGTALSRLSEVISAASGEYKHKIISPVADISRASNRICVPGAINWVPYVE